MPHFNYNLLFATHCQMSNCTVKFVIHTAFLLLLEQGLQADIAEIDYITKKTKNVSFNVCVTLQILERKQMHFCFSYLMPERCSLPRHSRF